MSGYKMGSKSLVSAGKINSYLPSTTSKFSSRHAIIVAFFLFTLSHHIPNANGQPLLNQLAVLLRARPPWPTSFPAAATQNQQQGSQQQQQQHSSQQQPQLVQQQQFQSSASIPQQISVQSNHVYPTSSEQLQNFMASNNLLNGQGPLSQGIPVVAMDPSQNSITIMTPTGPEQIMPPSLNGGVFVAQPIPQRENAAIHNGTHSMIATAPAFSGVSNNGNNGQNNNNNNNNSNNINGNSNNSPPGALVQVLHNPVTFDGQNLIEGSFFTGGIPQLSSSSGNANIQMAPIPPGYSSDQHHPQMHQTQAFPGGFFLHSHPAQGLNSNNGPPIINAPQQMISAQVPPPPPPIPNNLKGPAIIAVPKPIPPSQSPVLMPSPTYLGQLDPNLQHLPSNPSGGTGSGSSQHPIIIHSFHQLPNLTPAFPQLLSQPPRIQFPQEHVISLPENAIADIELNKTSVMHNEPLPQISSHFQPSQPEQPQPGENTGTFQSEKLPSPEAPKTGLSPEIVGNPRNQRKRHHKQRQRHQQQLQEQIQHYEQHRTTRGRFRQKPTTRPTQIPLPSESIKNEIDNNGSPSLSDYSLSTIINLPSTTITGSFEYPDPPTPPNFESMNALKYPSPYEDSAEVVVKDPSKVSNSLSTSSRERERIRVELNKHLKSSLHLHNSPFSEVNRKPLGSASSSTTTTTTTTGTHSPTAAEASNSVYRSISTAAALPETTIFESDDDIRDTTTFPASTTTIIASTKKSKKDKHRRKGKSGKSKKAFRPSPQIHSFEEPVTGIKSYITILPPVTTLSGTSEEAKSDETTARQRGKKSLFSKFEASESKHPPFEKGFKPVSHYTTYAMGQGNTIPSASTTTETLYFDLIREVVSKAPIKAWSKPDLNSPGEREHRKLVTSADGLLPATPYNSVSSSSIGPNYGFTTLSSASSSTDSFVKAGWKVKDHLANGEDGKRQVTTSASSELVEDWRFPDTPDGSKDSPRIYFGNGKFGPPNCDKFHRFGFCPMNSGYPTDQVEKIASRCSALLSHLIAPLPKADVRYDVIVAKNGSMLKGRSAAPSGWSWKSFSGKPVCDTKEIKVVPGWAKNEQGEWLVILQTKAWKQEAQVTLCTPQGTHYNCKGDNNSSSKSNKDCMPIKIKCVQRFTAQRLAVLDPENTDRCPVLRSVFLPSACVCLHDSSPSKLSSSSSLSSSEEISASSSNTNTIKVKSSRSGRSKSSSKSSKGRKGSSKGKKASKKSSSSKRNKKSSSVSGRNARKSGGNTSRISSSEEQENKSDMLDTAADSSNSVAKIVAPTSKKLSEKEQRQQEDESIASPEDEDEAREGPHVDRLISTQSSITTTGTDEDVSEDEHHSRNQNEVDDEDDGDEKEKNNTTLAGDAKSAITSADKDEEDDSSRRTTTVKSNSHGGSGTTADESSASEEGDNFEEMKVEDDA